MARDIDEDLRPTAEAPPAWPETMVAAAVEAGFVVETSRGASVAAAIARLAHRIGEWSKDPALGREVEALLCEAKIGFDPPLMRAALSDGAELAVSAALMAWPRAGAEELEALSRAQRLLACGRKTGHRRRAQQSPPSTPSTRPPACRMRAAPAASRSWCVQAGRMQTSSSPMTPRAPAPASPSPPARARSTPHSPISPSRRCAAGLIRAMAACAAKPRRRVSPAPLTPTLSRRSPAP